MVREALANGVAYAPDDESVGWVLSRVGALDRVPHVLMNQKTPIWEFLI